ncbi:MAG: hypothetical protein DRN95_09015, partial [Candidatus Hydrothermarchaeota archaeon]
AVLASLSVYSTRVSSLGSMIVSKTKEYLALQDRITSLKAEYDAVYGAYSEASRVLATIDKALNELLSWAGDSSGEEVS